MFLQGFIPQNRAMQKFCNRDQNLQSGREWEIFCVISPFCRVQELEAAPASIDTMVDQPVLDIVDVVNLRLRIRRIHIVSFLPILNPSLRGRITDGRVD
jgi:hypothetical protein